jgi:hypothetical protein
MKMFAIEMTMSETMHRLYLSFLFFLLCCLSHVSRRNGRCSSDPTEQNLEVIQYTN